MALLLLIETSTTACSVALAQDGKLIAEKELNEGYSHAENLSLFCQDVLAVTGHSFSQLNGIVVSKGPGSYTGLRIGVSTAKGFCYALSIPLLSIPTLQHMANALAKKSGEKEALYCPMLDARRMEVYCAIYNSDGLEIEATAAKIIDEHSFSDLLKNQPILFFGDGAAKCKTLLESNKNARFVDGVFPSAKSMIELAEEKFQRKEFENTAYFEPYYLKDFIAGSPK